MKRTAVPFLLLALAACGKDRFQTQPQLEITEYNSKEISSGQRLQVTIRYTDQEGDLAGGEFFAVRERLNVAPLSPNNDIADTLRYPITAFPNKSSADLFLELDYGFLKEHPSINDTVRFRIAVTDVAGNKSDTVTTDNIAIIR